MAEPRKIKVTRWVCGGEGCTRSYSKRETIETHMETCWRVPENRACHTCKHFHIRECCSTANVDCGCMGRRDWECDADVPLVEGLANRDCPSWEWRHAVA